MNEILIRHENQLDLCFQGQLIEETKFSIDLNDEERREFTLTAYAIEGGGFVPMLQYDTTSKSESPLVTYEELDQFKDVENFFYMFEAKEVIIGYDRLARSDREQAAKTCKQIAKVYEASLFRFLDLIGSRTSQQKFGDRVEVKAKPSILRTLGLIR